MSLLAELLALESELMTQASRSNRARLEALLAPDFQEFGRSGRRYDRPAIIAALLAESGPAQSGPAEPPLVHAPALRQLSDTVALLTYQTERQAADGGAMHTNRSSLWVRHPAGWRLAFHLGTPAGQG